MNFARLRLAAAALGSPTTPLVLAVLAGCGPSFGAPRAVFGEAAVLPLVHTSADRDRWYVEIDVEGHGTELFFLDTGYSYVACDDGLAERVGLRAKGLPVRIHGEAGSLWARRARVPTLHVGEHRVEKLGCLIRDVGGTSSIPDPPDRPVAGVLGANVLRKFDVVLDFDANTLELRRPGDLGLQRGQEGVFTLKPDGFDGMRFRLPVEVENQPIRPILDTGTARSLLDMRALGLEPYATREGVTMGATGGTGTVVRDLEYFHPQSMTVGGFAPEHAPIVVGRERGPFTAGLLGLDAIDGARIELDPRHRLARVTAPR